jgi:hypothetical protein
MSRGHASARFATSFVVACLLAGARLASAQTRPTSAVIDGIVTDTSLARLAGATVAIAGSPTEVTTDERGHFRILGLSAGRYVLMIRHVGFASLPSVVDVAERDTVRGAFTLERLATSLDTVVVAEHAAPAQLSEFEQHRKLGQGQFMTRAQIEKLNFVDATNLLRSFQSVSVTGRGALNRRMSNCPFQFFIEGVRVSTPVRDSMSDRLDLPSVGDIEGIEVYTNTATVPLQYKTFGGDSRSGFGGGFCGVILIWLRHGL